MKHPLILISLALYLLAGCVSEEDQRCYRQGEERPTTPHLFFNGEECIRIDPSQDSGTPDATPDAMLQCTSNLMCTDASESRCDDTGTCQECEGAADCSHLRGLPECEDGVCVQCTTNADCDATTASVCTNNVCTACETGGEGCRHLTDTPACGPSQQCVECAANDEDKCGADVCDVPNNVCIDVEEADLNLCNPCTSSRACKMGQACVAMQAEDEDGATVELGNYCVWTQSAEGDGAPDGSCPMAKPYFKTEDATTVEGETLSVCVPNESTCEGFNGFRSRPCDIPDGDEPESCGAPSIPNDGYCGDAGGGTLLCTVPCSGLSTDNDCPEGFACVDAVDVGRTGSQKLCSLTEKV